MPIEKSHVLGGKTGSAKVVKENPFVDIRCPSGQLIAQNGKVMHPGGEICEPVPQWFWDEWERVNPVLKDLIGLKEPKEPVVHAPNVSYTPAPAKEKK